MQKEAFFFSKYCLTLRDETEWTELVDNKVNVLVGAREEIILSTFKQHISKPFPLVSPLYGDGYAAQKIAEILANN
jgi:UDP-GlcNAc3NAcA epimerase